MTDVDPHATPSTQQAKAAARTLRGEVGTLGARLSHSEALEILAHQLGHRDWNTAAAILAAAEGRHPGARGPYVGAAVPVLRVIDANALAFYDDGLGFSELWKHRFGRAMPRYVRLRRDYALLDLSEHHGEGTPGSVIWLPVSDIESLHRDVHARLAPRQLPGVDLDAPGGPTMTVTDPSGNTLRFSQPSR